MCSITHKNKTYGNHHTVTEKLKSKLYVWCAVEYKVYYSFYIGTYLFQAPFIEKTTHYFGCFCRCHVNLSTKSGTTAVLMMLSIPVKCLIVHHIFCQLNSKHEINCQLCISFVCH